MRVAHPRLCRAAACGLVLLAVGCVPPDRWRTFEAASQRPAPPVPVTTVPAVPAVTVPDAFRPRLEAPAAGQPAVEQAVPEETGELSLEQAVLRALRSNRDLQVNQLRPVIAGTFEQLERGAYDPEVFGELSYSRDRAREASRSTGGQFRTEDTDTSAVLGVRQPLPSGTSIEATVEQDRATSNRTPDQNTARVGLSVTQALLRGRGPEVNLASVRLAEMDTLASVYELRGFTEALLSEVEIAYWNFVLAVHEIEIFERSLAVARQQRDEIEQRIEVGILPEIEAAAARAEVARREQALITAQSLREEHHLRLLRLIGYDFAGASVPAIRATSEPKTALQPVDDLTDRLALADRSRPDLGEARLRLDQRRLETVVTRNGVLPRLDLFLTLGTTGYAETFGNSVRNLGGDTYDFSAGVRFSHLLGNRSARAERQVALATQAQAAEAVANLQSIVRLDVRLAVNAVERTRRQITATAATRRFQEETSNAEQERFAVGASTALLVAQAQRDLLASQIAESEAIVNHRIALTRLYLAEGSLLDRRGVTLGPVPSR